MDMSDGKELATDRLRKSKSWPDQDYPCHRCLRTRHTNPTHIIPQVPKIRRVVRSDCLIVIVHIFKLIIFCLITNIFIVNTI